jgi:hypothetical protein
MYDILFVTFYLFLYINNKQKDLKNKSFENAISIIDLEKRLGMFYEEALQKRFLCCKKDMSLLQIMYFLNYAIPIPGLLLFLFLFEKTNTISYHRIILYMGNITAVLISYLFPVMPPRFLEKHNNDNTSFSFQENKLTLCYFDIEKYVNIYAAFPSMHFYNSLWFSTTLFCLFPTNPFAYVFFMHSIVTLYTIVVAGHHYFIDCFFSLCLFISISSFFRYISFYASLL